MGALLGAFGEDDAVVGQDGDRIAPDAGETADQGRAVQGLELVELGAVDQAGDDLAHVIGGPDVVGDQAVQLFGGEGRGARFAHVHVHGLGRVQIGDDGADDLQRVFVILGHMVDHARTTAMGLGPAQFLGRNDLAGGGLHQGRAGQEDGALVPHDDRLVRHGRHIGAAGGGQTHDTGDLGDALGAHPRLIEEDAAEVVAVGEDLGLVRQVGPARVHQIDARQAVLLGYLLGAQVLLHRHGEVGAAFNRRVVGDDHHLATRDAADPRDHAGGRGFAVVHGVGGQLADLQEGRAGIQQPLDPVAGQQLAAGHMPFARLV